MKKGKVTIQRGLKALANSGSIQITVPKKMRQALRIKPKDQVIVFQYEGPTVETSLFSIRSGDVVIRKEEPVLI